MLTDWTGFLQKEEIDQAKMLLDTASAAWVCHQKYPSIAYEVREYLKLGYEVLEGRHKKIPQLVLFLEDPEMRHDFGAFYEFVKDSEEASAALDLASYACGFVLRIASEKSGYTPLPDPVVESLPEIYEYYQDRAEFLGV